jgi:hypothetical protein
MKSQLPCSADDRFSSAVRHLSSVLRRPSSDRIRFAASSAAMTMFW